MGDTIERPPGLDEQYLTAKNTSDLTLNPDGVCAATHMIAAGLLGNRMGEALANLRTEWDGKPRPRKWTEEEIAAHAKTLPKRKDKPDMKRARGEARLAYTMALRRHMEGLQARHAALRLMLEWAQIREADPEVLAPALQHWLHPNCPVCDGLGETKAPDAPVLLKKCSHCNGAGKWPTPPGAGRVLDWLKGCVGKAKGERASHLHGEIDCVDLQDEKARRKKRWLETHPEPELSDEERAAIAAQFVLGKRT